MEASGLVQIECGRVVPFDAGHLVLLEVELSYELPVMGLLAIACSGLH